MIFENQNLIVPIIIAGGSGTRLWPLSTPEKPKQFLKLISDETLFQSTLKRMINIPQVLDPIVICNERHINLVNEQSQEIGAKLMQIILETAGRNTAPAITIASIIASNLLLKRYDHIDPILLVLPADHAISDINAFNEAILSAYNYALLDHIVCFGILPRYPETGYGYIKIGSSYSNEDKVKDKIHNVECFVEKPNLELAKQYFSSKQYLWNSGMLMLRSSVLIREMQRSAPDILLSSKKVVENSNIDTSSISLCAEQLALCRSESIDKAVMEHTKNSVVVSLDAGWSDLGSFDALEQYKKEFIMGKH